MASFFDRLFKKDDAKKSNEPKKPAGLGNRKDVIDAAVSRASGDDVRESNETQAYRDEQTRKMENDAISKRKGYAFKKGGSVKSSASRRADGIASRGKTKGRMI